MRDLIPYQINIRISESRDYNKKFSDYNKICHMMDILSSYSNIFELFLDSEDPSLHLDINDIVNYGFSKGFIIHIKTYNFDLFKNNYLMKNFLEGNINSIRFYIFNSKDLNKIIKLKKDILNYGNNNSNDNFYFNKISTLLLNRMVPYIVIDNMNVEEFEKIYNRFFESEFLKNCILLIKNKTNNLEKILNFLFLKYNKNVNLVLEKNNIPSFYLDIYNFEDEYLNIAISFKNYFNSIKIPSELIYDNKNKFQVNIDLIKKNINLKLIDLNNIKPFLDIMEIL